MDCFRMCYDVIFRIYEKAASAPKVCTFRFLILIATFGRILHCFALIHIRIQYRKTVCSIYICTFTCLGLKYSKIRKYEMRKMRPEVTSYFAYCARSFGFSDSSRRFRGNPSLVLGCWPLVWRVRGPTSVNGRDHQMAARVKNRLSTNGTAIFCCFDR